MLADAGLLVHIFDGWEKEALYEASPTGMSTSLIFADQHPPCCPNFKIPTFTGWATGVQGIILRPGPSTRILCGNSADSNDGKCKEWCPPAPLEGYAPETHDDAPTFCRGKKRPGSWHPEDFNAFLFRTNIFQTTLQAPRGGRLDYNEIVVDGAHWTEHLPTTIEAFFQSSDHGRGRRNDHIAREQHLHFLLKYGLTAEQVPLLDFDPHNWETPFQLAVGG